MWIVELYKLYIANKEKKKLEIEAAERKVKEEAEEKERKEKFIMVKTMEHSGSWVNKITNKHAGSFTVTFYLYENGLGERKAESVVDGYFSHEVDPKANDIYRKTIFPWTNGVDHVDIQTYNQALHGNVMTALKRPPPPSP